MERTAAEAFAVETFVVEAAAGWVARTFAAIVAEVVVAFAESVEERTGSSPEACHLVDGEEAVVEHY